jgi:branched-chain amino acid transport system permease protein
MVELITTMLDVVGYLAIYLIVTLALNLQYGCTGIPNFGLNLCVASGAFITGAISGRLALYIYFSNQKLDFIGDNPLVTTLVNQKLANDPLTSAFILVLTITLAMLTGTFFGIITCYPAIRLRNEYLMITLISMAEAMRIIGNNYSPLVGGTLGVSVPDFFAASGNYGKYIEISIIVVMCIAAFLLSERTVHSPFGRLLKAVRESETTTEAVGKDTVRLKFQILALSSLIGSLGGALYAINSGAVVALAYNRSDWTFIPWLFMTIGGTGNNRGVAIGVLAVGVARKLIIDFSPTASFLPFSTLWVEPLLIGLALISFIMYRPQGLLSERSTEISNGID